MVLWQKSGCQIIIILNRVECILNMVSISEILMRGHALLHK